MLAKRVDRSGSDWDSHLPYIVCIQASMTGTPSPCPRVADLEPHVGVLPLRQKCLLAREEALQAVWSRKAKSQKSKQSSKPRTVPGSSVGW